MLSDFVTDLKNNFCWKLRKNNCSSLSLVDARKGNYSEISCVKIVLRNFLLEISLREISGSGKAAFLWKGSVDKRVERGRNCCSFFDSLIVVAMENNNNNNNNYDAMGMDALRQEVGRRGLKGKRSKEEMRALLRADDRARLAAQPAGPEGAVVAVEGLAIGLPDGVAPVGAGGVQVDVGPAIGDEVHVERQQDNVAGPVGVGYPPVHHNAALGIPPPLPATHLVGVVAGNPPQQLVGLGEGTHSHPPALNGTRIGVGIPLPSPASQHVGEVGNPVSSEGHGSASDEDRHQPFQEILDYIRMQDDRNGSVASELEKMKRKHNAKQKWPKLEFESDRSQHEYDSLREIGRELEMALNASSWRATLDSLGKVQHLAAERATVLVVAEEQGWTTAGFIPEKKGSFLDAFKERTKEASRKAAKHKDKKGKKRKYPFYPKSSSPSQGNKSEGGEKKRPTPACFGCGGPHFIKKCPNRFKNGGSAAAPASTN